MIHDSATRHFSIARLARLTRAAGLGAALVAGAGRLEAQASAACASARAMSDDGREQTADQQVFHTLNRLAFGPRPGDVQRIREMGLDCWIARQLQPAAIDNRALDDFATRYAVLGRSAAELAREYPPPQVIRRAAEQQRGRGEASLSRDDSVAFRQSVQRSQLVVDELVSARVARAVASERQLEEVMVDFWLNHFNVFAGKGQPMRYFLVEYERDVIRPRAFGKFRDLLGAVAKSPAMMFYLDNWQSMADSGRPRLTANGRVIADPAGARRAATTAGGDTARMPRAAGRRRGLNENYGRELLELHTLGVDGGYTQVDVVNVARALTGWTIDDPRQAGAFFFRPAMHDAGDKVVLGRALRGGRGIEDGEEVLDIVARHPATARFIATKLARRFVSDAPPKALVDRAAQVFTRTNGDIREVVRTIVTSPEFFSRASYRAKVKSPFEVVVSALRALNAAPDPTRRTAHVIARLGQQIYGHQAPNGWPETGESWINTGAILSRINFGLAMATGRLPGTRADRWPLPATLASASRAQQVDGVVAALLGGDVSPDTRQVLLSGENPLMAASALAGADSLVADDGAMRGRAGAAGRPPALTGLAQVVGLALGSPEFQRR